MVSLSAFMNKKGNKDPSGGCHRVPTSRDKSVPVYAAPSPIPPQAAILTTEQKTPEEDQALVISVLNSRINNLETKVEMLEAKVERSENYSLQLKMEVERLSKYTTRPCLIVNGPPDAPKETVQMRRPRSPSPQRSRTPVLKPQTKKDSLYNSQTLMNRRSTASSVIIETTNPSSSSSTPRNGPMGGGGGLNKRSSWYNHDDGDSFDEKFQKANFVGDTTKNDPPVVVKLRRSRSNVR